MKNDINYIKRVILSLIWVIKNYLRLKYIIKKKYGIKRVHILNFSSWHGGACYFIGEYKESQVFIKTLSSKLNILKNEQIAIQTLSINPISKYTPKLYFHGRIANDDFVAMEYISDKTLDNHLDNGLKDFTALEREEIAIQLTKILDDLHSSRIVHRDLRPDNIFVNNDNGIRLILIDFSFAVDSNTWENTPRLLDIRRSKHSDEIWKALGEEYKPGKLLWDDAFSVHRILNENNHLFELDVKLLNQVKNKIGREVSTIDNI